MGPRSSGSIRKKILVWTTGGRNEPALVECLRGTGYEPVVYTDVHDVVAVSAAEVPDLIVLDVEGGPGAAEGVIAQLAARGADKNLPMLVLTGAEDAPPPHAPPEAATEPMLATTGLPASRSRTTSRQIASAPV